MNCTLKCADCAQTRRSQPSVNARPPPTATPFTAAITGCGIARRCGISPAMCSCERMPAAGPESPFDTLAPPVSLRSRPEQNARPAPVRIATRSELSAATSSSAAWSSSTSGKLSAFSRSGRFKVISATCGRTLSSSTSAIPAPRACPRRGAALEHIPVTWDFSTEPEFEEHLAWMRELVIGELEPFDTFSDQLDQEAYDRILEPYKQQVKGRGLWAAHLDPELGGKGFGQVRLALMHE